MSTEGYYLCRLTAGLDDLTIREQRDAASVLRVLERTGRFSVFEATANQTIARTMDWLGRQGYIERQPIGYPWIACALTERGRALLGAIPQTVDEEPGG